MPHKDKGVSKGAKTRAEIFAYEYVRDGNGRRSAIAAGYSEKTADSRASYLVRTPKVAALIASLHGKACIKSELTAQRVREQLARLAFYDPRKIFDPATGDIKPLQEWGDAEASALVSFDIETLFANFAKGQARPIGTIKRLRFDSRGQNLERAMKFDQQLGFRQQVNVDITGPNGVPLIHLSEDELRKRMLELMGRLRQANPDLAAKLLEHE